MNVWYKDGLKFGCTECGLCCTKEPGYVWLTEEDIKRLSTALSLSRKEFLKKYTRQVFNRHSLLEDEISYDCIFLKDKRCTVYKNRPKQCIAFPWWKSNLVSQKTWEEAKHSCEGIDHESGRLYTPEEIRKQLIN